MFLLNLAERGLLPDWLIRVGIRRLLAKRIRYVTREDVAEQETLVAFLPTGESKLELVQPTTETSGMAKYLVKRGPGMHHVCLEVDDIEAALARLKKKDMQLINEEPVIGAGGKKVAFIHPKSTGGVLVELVEKENVAEAPP